MAAKYVEWLSMMHSDVQSCSESEETLGADVQIAMSHMCRCETRKCHWQTKEEEEEEEKKSACDSGRFVHSTRFSLLFSNVMP